ncbi:right-handed parallel beta-helix repeat-containing protein [Sunxiuqinia sp. sy24]|uniref:right-handed parallel beta-helix repeat-containing protein n=1 Tax=Sunxiuqinia sp. sy24 TaxID=3461495 RepID=UPI004046249D
MRFTLILSFLCLLFISSQNILAGPKGRGISFYIAPDGSDENPGTIKKPFATFERAQEAVRAVDKKGDVIVYVRGGKYALKHTVEFDSRDSGAGDGKIIFQAYEGEIPIISGGERVTDWTFHDTAQNIYKAYVGSRDFRQLYVNGDGAIRARYPNKESDTTFGPYLRLKGADVKQQQYKIPLEDWNIVKEVTNLHALELVAQPHWIHHNARYESHVIDGDQVAIIPAASERLSCFNKGAGYFNNAAYHFENALELIDADGEWYLDRDEGMLYYKAPKGMDMIRANIEIPVLEVLFSVVGKPTNQVNNLEFRGLTFECTNWLSPSEVGLSATQFVQPYSQFNNRTYGNRMYPQAAIKVMHANKLAIRNSVIRNTGAHGIQFFQNVDDADIEGNVITNIGANGIELDAHGNMNAKDDELSSCTAIWNNKISRCGRSYSNGGGILAHNVSGLVIECNEVFDMPYSGMQIGDQPGGYNDTGCHSNMIRYNHVHHCMQLHDDGGGIYTLGGNQRGTIIAENYLHHINRSKWAGNWHVDAIYLDNYTQFIEVKNNVVHNAKVGGSHNHSRNNPFTNNGPITEDNKGVVENAGVKKGYNPRH